jgi:hypothetical protein
LPSADCRNCDIRKSTPNRPAYMKKLTALALARSRRRKSAGGSIGSGARRSQAANA